jgi:hypothetical protein
MSGRPYRAEDAGLTFLEVLLAVSMLGLLLVGGSSMLFALTRSYFTLETGPQFERHVDGVTEMLHYLASFSDDPKAPLGRHFGWSTSPISKKPTLHFSFDREMPFFVSDLRPLPPVKAFLEYEEENGQFWLVWYPDPTLTGNEPDYQYTLLSAHAADIEYGYYDASQKSWEFELASSESRQQANARPQRINLIFEYNDVFLRRRIDFNPENQHVLVY